jgi:hypothetical protein
LPLSRVVLVVAFADVTVIAQWVQDAIMEWMVRRNIDTIADAFILFLPSAVVNDLENNIYTM